MIICICTTITNTLINDKSNREKTKKNLAKFISYFSTMGEKIKKFMIKSSIKEHLRLIFQELIQK
jgi:bacterioferritin-associated ferredoxin